MGLCRKVIPSVLQRLGERHPPGHDDGSDCPGQRIVSREGRVHQRQLGTYEADRFVRHVCAPLVELHAIIVLDQAHAACS